MNWSKPFGKPLKLLAGVKYWDNEFPSLITHCVKECILDEEDFSEKGVAIKRGNGTLAQLQLKKT